MKRTLAALLGLLVTCAFAGGASADGTSRGGAAAPAVEAGATNWSGFYFGGSAGYAWSDVDAVDLGPASFYTPNISGDRFSFSPEGWIGGGHIGAQHQFGAWVLGAELSLSGGDLQDHIVSPFFPASDREDTKIGWIFTATGRLGYAWDRWLTYVKAGYASAKVTFEAADVVNAQFFGSSERHHGWTVGIGSETKLHSNLVFGIEYNFIDLEDRVHAGPRLRPTGAVVGAESFRVDPDSIHAVTARLSFLFGRETPREAAPLK